MGEAGGFADGLGDMSDESDIMENLEEDGDGNLTKRGKKDLKKALKAGKVSEEGAAARLQGKWKGKAGKKDADTEARKERIWQPDGEYIPAWSALMSYEKAQDVVELGADFVKKTPGTIFNK